MASGHARAAAVAVVALCAVAAAVLLPAAHATRLKFVMPEMSLIAVADSLSLRGTSTATATATATTTTTSTATTTATTTAESTATATTTAESTAAVDAAASSTASSSSALGRMRRKHSAARRSSCGDVVYGVVTLTKTNGMAEYTYQPSCDPPAKSAAVVAYGMYKDTITSTGWGELTIDTSPKHSDLEQAFAAGYLEGAITRLRIWQISRVIKKNHDHSSVRDYFRKQDTFLRSKVAEVDPLVLSSNDRYWFQVALVLAQMDGVLAGYNAKSASTQQLTRDDMWLMNSDGDVLDVERAATPGRVFKRANDMTKAELIELISMHSHCSALVKWTGDELFAAHTTWDDYTELLRIYKHYNLQFQTGGVQSKRVSHSSYPGFISSSDDFYILDTGLVVIETTLNILDDTLYDLCDPSTTVLAWVRNLVANRMSTTGQQWCDVFSQYNSGTYNDHWMIVDYKLFEPNLPELKPHTVWIMEQIPGYVEKKDISALISKDSYWASYNRPFFEEVNVRSMYRHYTNVHGEMFSYHQCPRAKIFMRDQANIVNLEGMKQIMMSNNWQSDPYSKGCPGNAIAARFDIEAPNCAMARVANGATDSKVTSSKLAARFAAHAIAGPSHQTQAPFTWNDPLFDQEMHEGQPTVWEFDWMEMKPYAF